MPNAAVAHNMEEAFTIQETVGFPTVIRPSFTMGGSGGGIRNMDIANAYIEAGVGYLIIGTMAVTHPEFVSQLCREFPDQVIVGLDANDGLVATEGWAQKTDLHVVDLSKKFEQDGVSSIVYTDIARDGMMQGIRKLTTQLRHKLRMRHCHCANNQITNPCFNIRISNIHITNTATNLNRQIRKCRYNLRHTCRIHRLAFECPIQIYQVQSTRPLCYPLHCHIYWIIRKHRRIIH
jgi:hypothetical protein